MRAAFRGRSVFPRGPGAGMEKAILWFSWLAVLKQSPILLPCSTERAGKTVRFTFGQSSVTRDWEGGFVDAEHDTPCSYKTVGL